VVYIKGLELNGQTYPLESEIIGGEFDLGSGESPKVIIGFHLRDQLGLGVGDTLAMISPLESSGPFYTPPVVRAEIAGVFRAELFQYDQIYAFTNIHAAQKLFRLGDKYTGVEFFLLDYRDSQSIAEQLRSHEGFQSLETTTWYERRSSLYNAMRMEKWGSFVALTLIIVVAIFNLVSSLLMLVLKKIRDIGILKTMGAEDGAIQRVFLRQGWYVGGIGTLVGVFSGVTLVLFQEFTGVFKLPGEAYFIDAVPVLLSPIDVSLISLISLTLSILSSVYPAKQAAKLEPIEAISYEH
jgi:lipoprotein-releasing system permease protein